MSTSVAVLGTGLMGAGMARSLIREGFDVTVWNRTAERARPLADDGATVVEELREAVSAKDLVLTMMFDVDATAEVMGRALPAWGEATWVQCGTVGIDETRRLAGLADEHDVAFVDAPVLGTKQPAEQGALILLASGPQQVRDRVAPVFDAIGSRTVWVGEEPGDGHRLKLVANSWVLSVVGATAQAVGMAENLGLDPQLFLESISGGPLDCAYTQLKGKGMIEGEFPAAFALNGAVKDTGLIAETLRTSGTDDRIMGALHELFRDADAAGHGAEDMSAVVRTLGGR
ncbi:NAD-binding protein [Allosaccharopolyspora coralli]|uniref:NAD-binding protein n=1 Tax=Allosaccharopolyspora coralli TaxID=2665642 RepID=A0A5Q3QDH1_9PSEU|nr:NAD(P)-dependent oxidoreductase [Allosaccharopolyspora coralli]QGK71406.1 NAD-binding protein [Allosaccharopolyspora coralli]